jgi:hypothetical protein
MSQSKNSFGANNNIKVEYHYGPRNSKQLFYNNNLLGYFRNDEITDTFKAVYLGHGDRSFREIEVRRSIEQMKLELYIKIRGSQK